MISIDFRFNWCLMVHVPFMPLGCAVRWFSPFRASSLVRRIPWAPLWSASPRRPFEKGRTSFSTGALFFVFFSLGWREFWINSIESVNRCKSFKFCVLMLCWMFKLQRCFNSKDHSIIIWEIVCFCFQLKTFLCLIVQDSLESTKFGWFLLGVFGLFFWSLTLFLVPQAPSFWTYVKNYCLASDCCVSGEGAKLNHLGCIQIRYQNWIWGHVY